MLRGEEGNLERRGERERIPGELPFRTNGVKRLSHQPLSIPRTFRFGFTAISCFLLPPSLPNPASAILIRTFSKREFEERTESFSKFRLQARWIITKRSSENKFQMIREFLIILPRGRKLSFRSEKVKLCVIVAVYRTLDTRFTLVRAFQHLTILFSIKKKEGVYLCVPCRQR